MNSHTEGSEYQAKEFEDRETLKVFELESNMLNVSLKKEREKKGILTACVS